MSELRRLDSLRAYFPEARQVGDGHVTRSSRRLSLAFYRRSHEPVFRAVSTCVDRFEGSHLEEGLGLIAVT